MSEPAIPESFNDDVHKWASEKKYSSRKISEILQRDYSITASRSAVMSCLKRAVKERQEWNAVLYSESDAPIDGQTAIPPLERLQQIDRDMEMVARRAIASGNDETLLNTRKAQARVIAQQLQQQRHVDLMALREKALAAVTHPPSLPPPPDVHCRAPPMDELEAAEANEEAWGRAQEIRAQTVSLQEVERQVDGLLNRNRTASAEDNWNEPKRIPQPTLPDTLPTTLPSTLPMIDNGLIRGGSAEEKNFAQTPCQRLASVHVGPTTTRASPCLDEPVAIPIHDLMDIDTSCAGVAPMAPPQRPTNALESPLSGCGYACG